MNIRRGWFLAAVALAACVDGPTRASVLPVLDDVGTGNWATVSAGQAHTCALDLRGHAYCWGSNQFGQLGVSLADSVCGSSGAAYACSLAPVLVGGTILFQSISAGGIHTCGISVQQQLYCWGGNTQFQLGDEIPSGPTMIQPDPFGRYLQVSAGFQHTCAVRTDGHAVCWGSNDQGEVGDGTSGATPYPVPVSGGQLFASLSAGQFRTCGILRSGLMQCWGASWLYRHDGVEYTAATFTPVTVNQTPALTSLSVGTFSTCGLAGSGTAYCWEANPRGEMGDGTTDGTTVPTAVSGSVQFTQITGGQLQTCAVAVSGVGYCWGDNTFGELGLPPGSLVERCGAQQLPCATRPTAVFGEQSFITISTGFGSHTCGVTTHHNVYCWGLGTSGQRGDGTAGYAVSVPVKIASPE